MGNQINTHVDATITKMEGADAHGYNTIKNIITDLVDQTNSGTVSAATQANPVKLTSSAHGLLTGHRLYVPNASGMTEIHQLSFTVTKVDANNFTIGVDGSGYTTFTTATTTKWMQPNYAPTIAAITQADPGVITTSEAHGLETGDEIYPQNVGGMTEINETWYTVTKGSATTINITPIGSTVTVDTSGYTTYTSGGTLTHYVKNERGLRKLKDSLFALHLAGTLKCGFTQNGIPEGYKS